MPWLQDPKLAILKAAPACCAGKSMPRLYIEEYQKLRSGTVSEVSSNAAPPQELLDELVSFCIQDRFKEVVSKAEFFVALFSNYISLHNILGVANAALRRHDAAIESYK